jgi:hypothetical protein
MAWRESALLVTWLCLRNFWKSGSVAGGKEEMALLTPDAFEDADEMQRQLGHANEEVRRSLNLPKETMHSFNPCPRGWCRRLVAQSWEKWLAFVQRLVRT